MNQTLVLISIYFYSLLSAASSNYACDRLMLEWDSQKAATEAIQNLGELEDQALKLNKANGQYKRTTAILADRRFRLLEDNFNDGEITEITTEYRKTFRAIEYGYYRITYLRDFVNQLDNLPIITSSSDDDQISEEKKAIMRAEAQEEIHSRLVEFGEHYVEYKRVRRFLERKLKSEAANDRFIAERIFGYLSLKDIAQMHPELNIDFTQRVSLEDIEQIFAQNAVARLGLIQAEINKSSQIRIFKALYFVLETMNKALLQIGGPKTQKVLTEALLLMSRDKYLRDQHLHKVERVLKARDTNMQIKRLMDFCNSDCEQFMETFARLGYLTEDWVRLKSAIEKKKDKASQYAHILDVMNKSELLAQKYHGLSLNYAEFREDRNIQLALSTSAVSFWTYVFSQLPSLLTDGFENLRQWLQILMM